MGERELIARLRGDLRLIARVAGVDAAIRIASSFRGSRLYIPGLDVFTRQVRDYKIREDSDDGVQVRYLSQKYGLTERQIWRILTMPDTAIPLAVRRVLEESPDDGDRE